MGNNKRNKITERDRAPVYIPFKTFLTAVETLGQGLPGTLDRSVWPSFAGGVQSQTLGAFKFLGLVDEDGKVQPILSRLVNAKGDERKNVLREIIESQYAEAIGLAEKNASFQQLQDLFRGYGVQATTLERVVRFFLDACEYAGVRCSPLWAKAKKTIKRHKRDEGVAKDKTKSRGTNIPMRGEIKPNIKTVQLKSGGALSLSLSVDFMALSREDREWLFDLIDRLNTYGQSQDEQK